MHSVFCVVQRVLCRSQQPAGSGFASDVRDVVGYGDLHRFGNSLRREQVMRRVRGRFYAGPICVECGTSEPNPDDPSICIRCDRPYDEPVDDDEPADPLGKILADEAWIADRMGR